MIRIDALAVTAKVVYLQIFRDVTDEDGVSNSVREEVTTDLVH
jgi:hypothetical protein